MDLRNITLIFFLRILPTLIENASPSFKESIAKHIKELEKLSAETENTSDELLVDILKAIFTVI